MPTYEYECKECSHNFEVFQSMSDEPLKICPECGKELRRLIFGGAGVIFKGSGFYVTDKADGKKAGKGKKQADSTASKEGDTSSTTSADNAVAKKDSDSKSGADQGKEPSSDAQKKTKPAAKSA